MATAVLKTFGALQEELEKAKENLKGVDDNIKRIIGRDPNEGTPRPGQKRAAPQNEEFRGKGRGFNLNRGRRDPGDNRSEAPEAFTPSGRRRSGDPKNVFSRLSGPPPRNLKDHESRDDDDMHKPVISSHVIATPREIPSRQEVMATQGDERSKARNRRMFGALLGTLQKFRQEETRMKDREDKRAQVERKLEEAARKEKEELKKERQELFSDRRRKQQEVRRIEIKMIRIKEQEEWESRHRPLMNFIQTKAKPSIFYLPKIQNSKTEERLVGSQKIVAEMMEKKRQQVHEDLKRFDARAAARAQRAQGGQFEEDENGVAEGEKGAGQGFDKENRLRPTDTSMEDEDKGDEEEEDLELERTYARSRKDRQRQREASVEEGEEELEHDEHAKEDDEDDLDMDESKDEWIESLGEVQRRPGNEDDAASPDPKRARRANSDDKQDNFTELDSSLENFERRMDHGPDSQET